MSLFFCTSDLKSTLQQEWDHAKNCHFGSVVVNLLSTSKVWWRWDMGPDGKPHQWESEVKCRSEGCDCPFCSCHAVCTHNSLASLAPHIAKEWDYAPSHYTCKSEKVVS